MTMLNQNIYRRIDSQQSARVDAIHDPTKFLCSFYCTTDGQGDRIGQGVKVELPQMVSFPQWEHTFI